MKMSELFEAASGFYGQDEKHARGASYMPSVRPTSSKSGNVKLRGSVPEWLNLMDVTQSDLLSAYAEVKKSPEYNAIISLGMKDESSAREIKNGTLNFVGYIDEFLYAPGDKTSAQLYNTRLRYKVLANGKIDVVASNDWNRYDLPVQKPVIVKGDPVKTVVKTMTNSLKRLHEVISKRLDQSKKMKAKIEQGQLTLINK